MKSLNFPFALNDQVDIDGDRRRVVLGSHKSTDLLSVSMVSEATGNVLTISLDPVDPKLTAILGEGEFIVKSWSLDRSMRDALMASGSIEVADDRKKAWMPGIEVWRLKGFAMVQFRMALENQEQEGDEQIAGDTPKA